MAFDYDVFVSYASADREWAVRLNDLLTAPGNPRRTFFDRNSLRAGDDWGSRIEQGLRSSEHFLVLWSPAALASQWVQYEITTYNADAKPQNNRGRRQIFVNLQGENAVFRRLQQITLPSLQHAYAGAAPETPGVWDELMVEVQAGLDPDRNPLSVSLIVLTLTRDQLNALSPKEKNLIEAAFATDFAPLMAQYGPERGNWRPLGGGDSIDDLLAGIKHEIELATGGLRLVWNQPGPAFWNDQSVVRDYVRNNFKNDSLALLVIDPVALHQLDIFQRLMCFQDCLGNEQTVIAVLPPFGLPVMAGLKQALLNRAAPYFDDYFKPELTPRRRLNAQCLWNASDADDIRRHLLQAAGKRTATPALSSPFTGL